MKNKVSPENDLRGFIKQLKQTNLLSHTFFLLIGLSLVVLANACSESTGIQRWDGITVDVSADKPVEISQTITREADGFQRLDITLSNTGNEVVFIDSIEIRIPIPETLTNDVKVAYGSSCMGQRPVLIHSIDNPQEDRYSYMYSMLQLDDSQYIFIGSLSWRIFIPTFTQEDNSFVIRSGGKGRHSGGTGRQLQPGESIHYEQIVLSRSSDWQQLLDSFGSAIARENGIQQVKDVNFIGWSSWDYYGYAFDVNDIYENADMLNKIAPNANLVQVDAGWYSQRGDFGQTRADFPGGMAEVNRQIEARGLTLGVWIDGFRANTDSEVFKNHPEYFLSDQNGDPIVRPMRLRADEGADPTRVYFDFSHPGARAHMAEAIRTIREDMGITYFKVDFMRFGLEDEILRFNPDVTSVQVYDPTITDVERMRLGLKAMSEAVGPENYLLGCSAVFGPCIGFVDGMRTGNDIHPRYEAFPVRVLANAGNSYLGDKVYNVDADFLVLREAADEDEGVTQAANKSGGSLSLNEAQMWADFNKLYGRFRLSGDKLSILRQERLDMLTEVFDFPVMNETIPIDFWQRARDNQDGYQLLLGRAGEDIYLGIFNWSDEAKTYDLAAFGAGPQTLEARHSKVLEYSGNLSFRELSKSLSLSLR